MGQFLVIFALLGVGSALDNGLAWTLIISVVCIMLVLEAIRMKRVSANSHLESE